MVPHQKKDKLTVFRVRAESPWTSAGTPNAAARSAAAPARAPHGKQTWLRGPMRHQGDVTFFEGGPFYYALLVFPSLILFFFAGFEEKPKGPSPFVRFPESMAKGSSAGFT